MRDAAFSVAGTSKGLLLRDERWAFIQYGEDARGGVELYDMQSDPRQIHNLAVLPEQAGRVAALKAKVTAKLAEVRTNDL